jgi:hypothetical protein
MTEPEDYQYQYPLEEPVTYTKPRTTNPRERFANIRRLVIFVLGVAIMIDALWDRQYVVPELIIGMIMVGVLPIDDFIRSFQRKPRG